MTAILLTGTWNLTLEVARAERVAQDVISVTLQAPDGAELPPWTPGAHIDLVFGNDLVRQYSLCGDPTDRTTYTVAILREAESRGGSSWAHDNIAAGVRVRASQPRNNFPLVQASRYIFIAGGIGVTPFLPMLRQLAGTEHSFVYAGTSRDTMAFIDELQLLSPDATLWPKNEQGQRVDIATLLAEPNDDVAIYCCGPESLLDAVEQAHAAAGWTHGSLHLERFRPPDREFAPNEAFTITADLSGVDVAVGKDETIVQALRRFGVIVPTSCNEGTCGTCECIVLDGIVEHRDSFISAEEHEEASSMATCVSRSVKGTPLVLDI